MTGLRNLRPVHVIGGGLHRYQPASDTPYVTIALAAVRQAVEDAGIAWPDVDSAYVGTCLLGSAPGRVILRHMGGSGLAITHIENASASGSSAFRQACMDVASGFSDVSIALGVDKHAPFNNAQTKTGVTELAASEIVPFTHFALLANEYMTRHGVTAEHIARVAVKNHRNGSLNPYAHRQQARSIDEIMDGPVSGILTRLQCCPVGDGAAAVIVASKEAMERLGIDQNRAVRVTASAARSERLYGPGEGFDEHLTRETVALALQEAGRLIDEVDVIELHDAFTIEELLYLEAIGLVPSGHAAGALVDGAFDIGGTCAVSPSGGLLSMGHPIGPTGVGQVVETVRQLRGEAGSRQQPGAKVGLVHMVGVGSVCVAHVLER